MRGFISGIISGIFFIAFGIIVVLAGYVSGNYLIDKAESLTRGKQDNILIPSNLNLSFESNEDSLDGFDFAEFSPYCDR